MKTILLSLKPEVFEAVLSGEKIYEHRRVFPDGPIMAYIYISRPVQEIKGILYLDNKVNIETWKEIYNFDKAAVRRIDKYLNKYKVAMEIRKFQNTSSISLKEIKNQFPNFVIPQMYYYLDEKPLLSYLKENMIIIGESLEHNFDKIDSNCICTK